MLGFFIVVIVVGFIVIIFGHLVFIIVGADGEGILRGYTLYIIYC